MENIKNNQEQNLMEVKVKKNNKIISQFKKLTKNKKRKKKIRKRKRIRKIKKIKRTGSFYEKINGICKENRKRR